MLAVLLFASARAEDYPTRPIRIVNPWPAGGSSDSVTRIVAAALSDGFGQQVVVDNRPGATGTIGSAAVAKGPADGYTLLLTTNSTTTIAPHLYKDLTYDVATAFAPISLIGRNAQILCVNPSLPATDLRGFLAYIKANPDKVAFSSAGYGATSHMATELLMLTAGIRMLHVPYKGGAPSVQALLAGETLVSFVDVITALPFVSQGQLRALGASTQSRASMMPDVPTIDEAGLPGFSSSTDFVLLAPSATPKDVVATLVAAVHRALRAADVRERLRSQGIDVADGGPDALSAYLKSETEKWGNVVRTRGIKID
ncbi:MAG TPA: tripartite tricarboxylate transporter substrate binding protein [Candidatus Sulfotelmatobacter sp.]|nr:tripartite tricarboxylate transporter substrate binding protein [Candidatus Sulfotelmatobacter sp.]